MIIVHNDGHLDPTSVAHPTVVHLHPGSNVGFGAAINLALEQVTTRRTILCNPDALLEPAHWLALDGSPEEVVTVPLVDGSGKTTSVVAPYWTPIALAITTMRLGARLAPLGSTRRSLIGRLLPGWSRRQLDDLASTRHHWSLRDRWVSGAVLSVDTERLRSVGGFDDRFFLYFEDTDLCRRLADRYPTMMARVATVDPATHAVGASATGSGSRLVEAIRRRSAIRYGAKQQGLRWRPYRLAASLLDR